MKDGNYMECYKTYKFRAYPNSAQRDMIKKTFDCCRFVYNKYLSDMINQYNEKKEHFGCYDYVRGLTNLKSEFKWLRDADSQALVTTVRNLDTNFRVFIRERGVCPHFKNRFHHTQSYRTGYTANNILFLDRYIKLPKSGKIKIRGGEAPNGRIVFATVLQKDDGKYYILLTCKSNQTPSKSKGNKTINITFISNTSFELNGDTRISLSEYLKKPLERMNELYEQTLTKSKGSANYKKAMKKFATQKNRVINQKNDFLHKLTTDILNLKTFNSNGMFISLEFLLLCIVLCV